MLISSLLHVHVFVQCIDTAGWASGRCTVCKKILLQQSRRPLRTIG